MSNPLQLTIGAAVFVFLIIYRARRSGKASVAHIVGPESPSFLIGNLGELMRGQAGEIDLKWQSTFGNIVRFKAAFGQDQLLISDPKAIHHILGGYRWDKSPEGRARSFFINGPSVAYVNGDDHKRHRRIMNPAFGTSGARALIPTFSSVASTLTNKWKDMISMSQDESEVLNIPRWISRATMDAIGQAGFGYDFGAMENKDDRLSTAYNNLFADMFAAPTDGMFIMEALLGLLPPRTAVNLLDKMSAWNPRLARGITTKEVAKAVARELVEEKSKEFAGGHGDQFKDVFSLLIKANMSETEKFNLNEEEMFAQMLVMFLAGHETTANSISWTLLELCRSPEIQDRLRAEIREKEREIAAEGRSGFTAEDLDSLVYMNAVLKESSRFHSPAIRITKMATADDCIPLAESVRTRDGKEVTEIPVSKGQRILLSIPGYNKNKAVFGDDSHLFRPERWLENPGKKDVSVGVFANLLTFSGGVRSCVGWRFAVSEIQVFLVELISNFEFSLTPKCDKIRRENCLVMSPTIEGELEKGVQCPLRVRYARRDGQH
ncbi:hypothetical protein PQX77_003399 [Marasmius sp. AFHP31]|nr:hypothetical protein PQX77_003399 [Marasmius sp. AFHP31]